MKSVRFSRLLSELRKQEASAPLAVGAMLVITILYATTII